MSKNNFSKDLNSNDKSYYKDLCEALECHNHAKNKINLNAGKYGNIKVNVCDDCLPLFQ
ncbi:MAG: hypothetical protein L0H53_09160 [Candidatus Nitrosocosmicus sp.]|nr:hypothetical protein [Candidatus Nitrosocosmicus sp.]MDN5868881.1 hypothetical protein [Candidatus Nitrosocosmicus sp.]